jgi:hypothetical protein
MSLRMGITAAEESLMKLAIKNGETWSDISKKLQDCDLDYVKDNLYDPMAAAQEQADFAAEAAKPTKTPAKS